jgi:hypothetical protein
MLTVVLWVLVESAQKYFYDESAASMLTRAMGAAVIIALCALLVPVDAQNMLHWKALLLHPVSWVLIFRFLFAFEFVHALFVGLISGGLIMPLVTITNASLFFPEWLTERAGG